MLMLTYFFVKKLDLVSRHMEKKSIDPKLTQRQMAQQLG